MKVTFIFLLATFSIISCKKSGGDSSVTPVASDSKIKKDTLPCFSSENWAKFRDTSSHFVKSQDVNCTENLDSILTIESIKVNGKMFFLGKVINHEVKNYDKGIYKGSFTTKVFENTLVVNQDDLVEYVFNSKSCNDSVRYLQVMYFDTFDSLFVDSEYCCYYGFNFSSIKGKKILPKSIFNIFFIGNYRSATDYTYFPTQKYVNKEDTYQIQRFCFESQICLPSIKIITKGTPNSVGLCKMPK